MKTKREKMMKVRVWFKENGEDYVRELRYLKPRRYMCGWDFNRMMKYTKHEREWEEIADEQVECIEIINEREKWMQVIYR